MTGPDVDRRVRAVFFGSGPFAIGSLQRAADHSDIELVGVITAPPRPTGRRRTATPTPVSVAAHELGLGPVLTPERLREPEAVAEILALEPGIAILADYAQLVPAQLLDLRHGALNLHPSLLPRHRGATPIPATILAGDHETGVTLFRMDRGLDTGPIVAQEVVALAGDVAAPELEARLAAVAPDLLERSLGPWLAGELAARPQSSDGATLTRPLRRDDGQLDPRRPAVELERAVRAFRPWPGTFVVGPSGRVAVLHAAVRPSAPGDIPGTFVAEGDGLAIATGDGRLVLEEVQPAGGRPMPGSAFRRGRSGIVGAPIRA
jgi:methionyl-tRNA formyltransferase